MKKTFLIILASVCISICYAQSHEAKKMIKKFDASYLKDSKFRYNPTSFWNTILEKDKNVIAYNKAVEKNNRTLNEAYGALLYLDNQSSGFEYITTSYNDIVSRLVDDLGIQGLVYNKPVKVIRDGSINASMDFKGQLRINEGCFTQLSYDELLAVCAHEMAHFACMHVIMSVWKIAKKQKSNRAWAGVGYSLAIGAMAASSVYAGGNGVDTSGLNDLISNPNIIHYVQSYADESTRKYGYRYSRNEETEADIIAYRFMEQTGHGGNNVISLLRKLLYVYGDSPNGIYKDHPSHSFRIEVISGIQNGYSGKK